MSIIVIIFTHSSSLFSL